MRQKTRPLHKPKKSKKKTVLWLLICACLLCALPSVFYLTGTGGYVRQALQTVLTPIESGLNAVRRQAERLGALIEDNEALHAEIRALQAEKTAQLGELADARGLKEENEYLSRLLGLKEQHADWSYTLATVASVQSENYSAVYTLDRGSEAGIGENMPVLTDLGLVGYVFEVHRGYCRVRALTDSAMSIAVRAPQSGETGLLEADLTLAAEGLCRVNGLSADTKIKPGELISTAGGSSIYPAGLPIGTVKELRADAQTLQVYAVVEPGQPQKELYKVMVLTGYTVTDADTGDSADTDLAAQNEQTTDAAQP